jgi:DNA-binding IclR family transcriptional regulator
MRKPKGEYSIQTVVNAMRLLEAFRDDEELGVTALSRQLGLHKNNVFRLLATLEQQSYIEQSADNDRYRLGVRALELGHAFSRSRSLLRRGRHALVDLAVATRETAHLAVASDFEVVHLDGEQTDRLLTTGLRLGRRLPAHATALGKVLLGGAPEDVREAYDRRIAARGGLEALTRNTIVDRDKLVEHLRGVSVRGFATDLGECEEGMCCAAAPVFDGEGRVVAALSVSAPVFRLNEDRLLSETAPQVVQVAERLSRDLGFGA